MYQHGPKSKTGQKNVGTIQDRREHERNQARAEHEGVGQKRESEPFELVFHEHPRALALDRGGREVAADEEHRPAGETIVVLEAHWPICSPNALFWALAELT